VQSLVGCVLGFGCCWLILPIFCPHHYRESDGLFCGKAKEEEEEEE
jgi:hypothetical protein